MCFCLFINWSTWKITAKRRLFTQFKNFYVFHTHDDEISSNANKRATAMQEV